MRFVRAVLQISGIELIVVGFLSWLAAVWVRSGRTPDERTLDFLVALAEAARALTHMPPYVGPTILGVALIATGAALGRLDTGG